VSAREAALRDVLDVINRNRHDPQPVFQTIFEKAMQICQAKTAAMFLVDEAADRA